MMDRKTQLNIRDLSEVTGCTVADCWEAFNLFCGNMSSAQAALEMAAQLEAYLPGGVGDHLLKIARAASIKIDLQALEALYQKK